MDIIDVPKNDLPGSATHGFKVVDENGYQQLFFHWHEDGEESFDHAALDDQGEPVLLKTTRRTTSYADVLKALPDRLSELGSENEIDAVLGEVVGRYGAGA